MVSRDSEDQKADHSRDAITRAIGSIGKWQIWMCLVVFLVKFPVAWHQMSILFLAPPTNFTCGVNEIVFDNKCHENCTEYSYDHKIFAKTIISEWNLVCNRAWLSNLTQTLFMLGILVGNMVFGHLSDRLVTIHLSRVSSPSSQPFVRSHRGGEVTSRMRRRCRRYSTTGSKSGLVESYQSFLCRQTVM